MNWQNVIVGVILSLCVLFVVFKLWKFFSKKTPDNNTCANCDCELRDMKKCNFANHNFEKNT